MTHDFDPRIVGNHNIKATCMNCFINDVSLSDWLLVASGVFTGLFAIVVAYWGNRIHRTAWLGGLFMLQSVLCLIVIIPTLVHQ